MRTYWLRTEQANRIINAVSGLQKCEPTDLVVVVNGGDDYGKEPKHWLKTQAAKDFINTMTEVRNLASSDLQQVTAGAPETADGISL